MLLNARAVESPDIGNGYWWHVRQLDLVVRRAIWTVEQDLKNGVVGIAEIVDAAFAEGRNAGIASAQDKRVVLDVVDTDERLQRSGYETFVEELVNELVERIALKVR